MLRQYLGEDQDKITAIKIALGVLKIHKHTKAPALRMTCKVLYQNMNLLEDRPGSNHHDHTQVHKIQIQRKTHEELSHNPGKQAHRTAQTVVNSTNQGNTTLQELVFVRHTNEEDEKSTMTLEKLVMGMVVTVLTTEYTISQENKWNSSRFLATFWLERMMLESAVRKMLSI